MYNQFAYITPSLPNLPQYRRLVLTISSVSIFLSLAILVPGTVFAELLGTDPIKGDRYECVREGPVSSNYIQVVDAVTAQAKPLKTKAVKRRLKRRIRLSIKKRSTINRLKRRAKNTLRKLLKKVPPPPNSAQKVIDLNLKIKSLDVRVASVIAKLAALRSLVKRVSSCKKPLPLSGGFEIVSGTYTVPTQPDITYFYANLVYQFDRPIGDTSTGVCAQLAGHSEQIDGMSAIYLSEPPVILGLGAQPSTVCLVFSPDRSCIVKSDGGTMFLAGINARLGPGGCSIPQQCSLESALRVLTERLNSVSMRILGPKLSGQPCSQDPNSYSG